MPDRVARKQGSSSAWLGDRVIAPEQFQHFKPAASDLISNDQKMINGQCVGVANQGSESPNRCVSVTGALPVETASGARLFSQIVPGIERDFGLIFRFEPSPRLKSWKSALTRCRAIVLLRVRGLRPRFALHRAATPLCPMTSTVSHCIDSWGSCTPGRAARALRSSSSSGADAVAWGLSPP